jgi:hypothetical protein
MYHLKRMIEVVKRDGVKLDGKSTHIIMEALADGVDNASFLTKQFFKYVEESANFVFTPLEGHAHDHVWSEITKEHVSCEPDGTHYIKSIDLDAPFKVFSCEILGRDRYIAAPNSEYSNIHVPCVLAVETKPRRFLCYTHFQQVENGIVTGEMVLVYNEITHYLKILIDRMNKEKAGTQSVKEKIRLGSGKDKRHVSIRKVIYISPKKENLEPKTENPGRVIDWQQRSFVRGHWRTLGDNKLGKDRSGDYCVPGETWVTEHTRGPEDKPLIKKTYVVKQENKGEENEEEKQ